MLGVRRVVTQATSLARFLGLQGRERLVHNTRSYVVLFGGGTPSGFTVPIYTDDGTIGDGLTDSGESIHLINDYGDEAVHRDNLVLL